MIIQNVKKQNNFRSKIILFSFYFVALQSDFGFFAELIK